LWIDYFADITLDEDRYIKAMEIKPGNRRIVHHVVMYVIEPDAPPGTPETGINLHEYAVGKYGDTFNESTGRLLKKGSRLRFDMHYFANGEESTDKTEMHSSSTEGFRPEIRSEVDLVPQPAERRARNRSQLCHPP